MLVLLKKIRLGSSMMASRKTPTSSKVLSRLGILSNFDNLAQLTESRRRERAAVETVQNMTTTMQRRPHGITEIVTFGNGAAPRRAGRCRMGKAQRKPRPSMPLWWWRNQDGCWFCKQKNNCNQCKAAHTDAKERDQIKRICGAEEGGR